MGARLAWQQRDGTRVVVVFRGNRSGIQRRIAIGFDDSFGRSDFRTVCIWRGSGPEEEVDRGNPEGRTACAVSRTAGLAEITHFARARRLQERLADFLH